MPVIRALQPATASSLGGVQGLTNLTIDVAGNLSLSSTNISAALGYVPAASGAGGGSGNADTLDGYHAASFYRVDSTASDQATQSSLKFNAEAYGGGWARGLRYDVNGSASAGFFGFGGLNTFTCLVAAVGATPWDTGNGLAIYSSSMSWMNDMLKMGSAGDLSISHPTLPQVILKATNLAGENRALTIQGDYANSEIAYWSPAGYKHRFYYNVEIDGTFTAKGGISIAGASGDPNPRILARVMPAGDPNAATEATELLLFHANDPINGAGPDYITLRAPAIRLQTYNDAGISSPDTTGGMNNRLSISPAGLVSIGVEINTPMLSLASTGYFGTGLWAGGYNNYPGWSTSSGSTRFGFSSTNGTVDVYADGNFYATDSGYQVWHAGSTPSFAGNVNAPGYSNSWGVTTGTGTGGINTIMGTSTGATWLWSGTVSGVFKYGFQAYDGGNIARLYVGSNIFGFNNADFTSDGNITAYAGVSDERLKKNIRLVEGALEKVSTLRAITHEWREDKLPATGFHPTEGVVHGVIAQDIQKVMPDAIFEAEGRDDEKYLGVRYERLTVLLLAAVQELAHKVHELEGKS